ncbi:MAG: cyclic nucleotide-binding domain-containing protein [Rubripirellula sp.]
MDPERDVIARLRAITALNGADERILKQLASISHHVVVPAGTLLFSEGQLHTDFHFVDSGTIALDMVTQHCGKQLILTVGEGDLLAWSALLGDCRMTASAVASTDASLITLPGADLQTMCDADHELGYFVMRCVSKLVTRRLLATRLQLLDLFHH